MVVDLAVLRFALADVLHALGVERGRKEQAHCAATTDGHTCQPFRLGGSEDRDPCEQRTRERHRRGNCHIALLRSCRRRLHVVHFYSARHKKHWTSIGLAWTSDAGGWTGPGHRATGGRRFYWALRSQAARANAKLLYSKKSTGSRKSIANVFGADNVYRAANRYGHT